MLFLGLPFFLVWACSAAFSNRVLLQKQHPSLLLQQNPESLGLLSAWEPWPVDATMKVVYGVFTSPLPKYAQQMEAVAETWAKDVAPQKMLVVGVNGSAPGIIYKQAPMCQDGHVTNPGISCKEATLLTTGHQLGADWVVVVGSDNYVFPRNFEHKLQSENASEAQILGFYGCGGGDYCEDHKTGLCGGGGYAISRGALDKMVGQGHHVSESFVEESESFVEESMHTAQTVGGYWSDQVTSCIARRRGVKEVDLEGLYGWKLCADHAWDCPLDESAYKQKILSSDPAPLTFHYIHPEEMRTLHKMTRPGRAAEVSLLAASSVNPSYKQQRAAYIRKMDKLMRDGAVWGKTHSPVA